MKIVYPIQVSIGSGSSLGEIPNAEGDILTIDGNGAFSRRTVAQILSDIGAASSSHTHVIADVTGLQTALDGKANTSHTHAASDVTSGTFDIARIPTGTTSTTVSLGNHNHTLDSLSNVTITSNSSGEILKWSGTAWINNTLAEAGIAAASHNHSAANITSGTLAVARGGTGIASYGTGNYIRASAATTLQQRTPAEVLSDIGAAAASHTHAISDVTNLQTTLDGKASTSHTHAAGDVTSGTFDIARIPTGTTSSTVSLGNHNHTLDSLSNVTISSIASNEILKWNGSAWINNTLSEAGIAAASHDHNDIYFTETESDARFLVVVEHGATAGTARPSSASGVYWIGSVEPTNKEEGDIWYDSGDSLNFVEGPASSTNNNLAAFDGTTGDLLKDSGIALSNVALKSGTTFTGQVNFQGVINIDNTFTLENNSPIYAKDSGGTPQILITMSSGNNVTVGDSDVDLVFRSASDPEVVVGGNTETIYHSGNLPETIIVCLSDETSDLATGTNIVTFYMPFAMTLTEVRASVNTAPTGSTIIVDINENDSTILSTKLSIDASENTSSTAASAAVISDTALADNAKITFDIDQVGSTNPGKGLKVYLKGTRA